MEQDFGVGSDGLDAPVANPGKIVAAPINYRDHIAEVNADQQINPGKVDTDISEYGLFLKANSSLCGPNEVLPLPIPGRRTDPEVELAVVIGHAPAPCLSNGRWRQATASTSASSA